MLKLSQGKCLLKQCLLDRERKKKMLAFKRFIENVDAIQKTQQYVTITREIFLSLEIDIFILCTNYPRYPISLDVMSQS